VIGLLGASHGRRPGAGSGPQAAGHVPTWLRRHLQRQVQPPWGDHLYRGFHAAVRPAIRLGEHRRRLFAGANRQAASVQLIPAHQLEPQGDQPRHGCVFGGRPCSFSFSPPCSGCAPFSGEIPRRQGDLVVVAARTSFLEHLTFPGRQAVAGPSIDLAGWCGASNRRHRPVPCRPHRRAALVAASRLPKPTSRSRQMPSALDRVRPAAGGCPASKKPEWTIGIALLGLAHQGEGHCPAPADRSLSAESGRSPLQQAKKPCCFAGGGRRSNRRNGPIESRDQA